MDTIIVNNQPVPILKDTIYVKTDYSLISTQIDSLRIQNEKNFKQLQEIILITSTENNKISKFISNDALVTTAITIGVFLIGLLFQVLSRRYNRFKERRKVKRAYKIQTDTARKYLKLIIKAYKKIVNETSVDEGILLSAPVVNRQTFERLAKSDPKEIIDGFKKVSEVMNILIQVGNINDILDASNFFHSVLRKKLDEDKEIFANLTRDFFESINQYLHELRSTHLMTYWYLPEYKSINGLYVNYIQNIAQKNKMQLAVEAAIKPLTEEIYKINLLKNNSIAMLFSNKGKKINELFIQITDETEQFIDQYREFVKNLEESKVAIDKSYSGVDWPCVFSRSLKKLTNLFQKVKKSLRCKKKEQK